MLREGRRSVVWPVQKVNVSADDATEWAVAVLVEGPSIAAPPTVQSVLGNLTLRHARLASEAMFIWKFMLVTP